MFTPHVGEAAADRRGAEKRNPWESSARIELSYRGEFGGIKKAVMLKAVNSVDFLTARLQGRETMAAAVVQKPWAEKRRPQLDSKGEIGLSGPDSQGFFSFPNKKDVGILVEPPLAERIVASA